MEQGRGLRVLVAMDDSPVSQRAAEQARRLFGAENTEFFVLNVARAHLAPSTPAARTAPRVRGPLTSGESWATSETFGLSPEELQKRARAAGLEAETVQEVGNPASEISETAVALGVDVVVVGAHHKGFLHHLIDPSVSQAVVRACPQPVLVVSE